MLCSRASPTCLKLGGELARGSSSSGLFSNKMTKFDQFRGDKAMPASLEPSSSAEELPTSLSVNAKIRAIEAKLQMMDEKPDEEYSGPSMYLYNKPPEKKRPAPYTKFGRKFRR
ncbi:hypothetical protein ANANG_G00262620 [Anguilla anguilla]|uniref:Uncharacterized protein n=1 Tax=Anguilla anguilla TaxID=7936 RepID=A0A9D3LP53_ANGAN|nr:hypothetical protein ANANG_G00262620 [Anguilla anguilla]